MRRNALRGAMVAGTIAIGLAAGTPVANAATAGPTAATARAGTGGAATSSGSGTTATTKTASGAVSSTRTVKLTRRQTRSVQRRVHVRPDGKVGARTRKALRRYQSRKDLHRTGRPNLETLHAMRLGFADDIEERLTRGGDRNGAASPVVAGYTFPIGGAWKYGSLTTKFGQRGGRHQGVDMFARCGTPLVAASAGTVREVKYQASAAGHYVVLTGTPTGEDQVYMHLQSASTLKVGDRVAAGSRVGLVGDTGNADGCHLHFELWSAPGWFAGGKPHDPQPSLDAWAASTRKALGR